MGGLYPKPRIPGAASIPLPIGRKDPYLWIILVVAFAVMISFAWLLISAIDSVVTEQDTERKEIWRGAVVVRVCRDGTHIWKLRDGRMQSGWGVTFDPKREPKDICD